MYLEHLVKQAAPQGIWGQKGWDAIDDWDAPVVDIDMASRRQRSQDLRQQLEDERNKLGWFTRTMAGRNRTGQALDTVWEGSGRLRDEMVDIAREDQPLNPVSWALLGVDAGHSNMAEGQNRMWDANSWGEFGGGAGQMLLGSGQTFGSINPVTSLRALSAGLATRPGQIFMNPGTLIPAVRDGGRLMRIVSSVVTNPSSLFGWNEVRRRATGHYDENHPLTDYINDSRFRREDLDAATGAATPMNAWELGSLFAPMDLGGRNLQGVKNFADWFTPTAASAGGYFKGYRDSMQELDENIEGLGYHDIGSIMQNPKNIMYYSIVNSGVPDELSVPLFKFTPENEVDHFTPLFGEYLETQEGDSVLVPYRVEYWLENAKDQGLISEQRANDLLETYTSLPEEQQNFSNFINTQFNKQQEDIFKHNEVLESQTTTAPTGSPANKPPSESSESQTQRPQLLQRFQEFQKENPQFARLGSAALGAGAGGLLGNLTSRLLFGRGRGALGTALGAGIGGAAGYFINEHLRNL